MKTLWCKNQENPSDRISHTWAPLTQGRPLQKQNLSLQGKIMQVDTIPAQTTAEVCIHIHLYNVQGAWGGMGFWASDI
jgi:hypothetical protein